MTYLHGVDLLGLLWVILTLVDLAVLVFVQVILEVFRHRRRIADNLPQLDRVPDGNPLRYEGKS